MWFNLLLFAYMWSFNRSFTNDVKMKTLRHERRFRSQKNNQLNQIKNDWRALLPAYSGVMRNECCIPVSIMVCRYIHSTRPQTHTCISVTLGSSWCFKCTQSESPDSHYGRCLVFSLSLCLPSVLYVMPGNFQPLRGKLFWVVVSRKALVKWD